MKLGTICVVSWIACGCALDQGLPEAEGDLGKADQEIRNGWIDSTYTYRDVASLNFIDPVTFNIFRVCSGSLVTSSRVLTAAHCFVGLSGPFYLLVDFSDSVRYGVSVRVHPLYSSAVNVATHPYIPGANHQIAIPDGPDLATVDLDAPLLTVPPRPIAASPVPAGQVVKIVGYGEVSTGTLAGQRLVGVEVVAVRVPLAKSGNAIMPNGNIVLVPFTFGNVGCPGDSGGPAVNYLGEIVAVQSFMLSPAGGCNNALANSLSTTQDFRTWILQSGTALTYHEYALPPDVDGDGVVTTLDSTVVSDAIAAGTGLSGGSFAYRDTTADDVLTTADAQYVLDVVNRSDTSGVVISGPP